MNSPQNATLMVDSVGRLYPEGSLSGLLRTDRVPREVLETVLATCSAQINVFSAVMEEFFAFVARESPDVLLALESEDLGRDVFWEGMCDTVYAVMSKVRSDQKKTYENNPLRTSLAAYCHKLPAPPPVYVAPTGFGHFVQDVRRSHANSKYKTAALRILHGNIYGATSKAVECCIYHAVLDRVLVDASGFPGGSLAAFLSIKGSVDQEKVVKAFRNAILAHYYPERGEDVAYAGSTGVAAVTEKLYRSTLLGNNQPTTMVSRNGIEDVVKVVIDKIDDARPTGWDPVVLHHGQRIVNLSKLGDLVDDYVAALTEKSRQYRECREQQPRQRQRQQAGTTTPFAASTRFIDDVINRDFGADGQGFETAFHTAVQLIAVDLAEYAIARCPDDSAVRGSETSAKACSFLASWLLQGDDWAAQYISNLTSSAGSSIIPPTQKSARLVAKAVEGEAQRDALLFTSVRKAVAQHAGDGNSAIRVARGLVDVARAASGAGGAGGAARQSLPALQQDAKRLPIPASRSCQTSNTPARRRTRIHQLVFKTFKPHKVTPVFNKERYTVRFSPANLLYTPYVTRMEPDDKDRLGHLTNQKAEATNVVKSLYSGSETEGIRTAKESWLNVMRACVNSDSLSVSEAAVNHVIDVHAMFSTGKSPDPSKRNEVLNTLNVMAGWSRLLWVLTAVERFPSSGVGLGLEYDPDEFRSGVRCVSLARISLASLTAPRPLLTSLTARPRWCAMRWTSWSVPRALPTTS